MSRISKAPASSWIYPYPSYICPYKTHCQPRDLTFIRINILTKEQDSLPSCWFQGETTRDRPVSDGVTHLPTTAGLPCDVSFLHCPDEAIATTAPSLNHVFHDSYPAGPSDRQQVSAESGIHNSINVQCVSNINGDNLHGTVTVD